MVLRDQEILSLCRARDQRAIAALAEKYGAYCHTVAHNILGDHPDAEECVNDAYLAVWNGVPSAPPRSLLAYLAKVTRNIALKRLEHNQAQKRGDRFYLLLDELAEDRQRRTAALSAPVFLGRFHWRTHGALPPQ